jgi:predicted PurR-regulated permease PerM
MHRLLRWLDVAGMRGWQLGGVAVGFLVIWTIFQRLLLLVVTIFVALLVAALMTPLARWLERHGVPGALAALITVAGGAVIGVLVTVLLGMQLVQQLAASTDEIVQVRQNIVTWLRQGPFDVAEEQLVDVIDQAIATVVGGWTAIVNRAFFVLTVVGAMVTALALAFFLFRDADTTNGWTLNRLVSDDDRQEVTAAGHRAGDALQGYIRATLIIGALDGLFIGVALVLLDVPLAVPLAALTFIGGFFPVIGATVAGVLATLVAAASNGIITGAIVLVVIIVVQQIDGNVFQPVIMGRSVHLHPIVVLAALTAGGILAGIIGAFMAVPIAAVLTAVGNEIRTRRGQQAPLAPGSKG